VRGSSEHTEHGVTLKIQRMCWGTVRAAWICGRTWKHARVKVDVGV
jgi:hypothetical protein